MKKIVFTIKIVLLLISLISAAVLFPTSILAQSKYTTCPKINISTTTSDDVKFLTNTCSFTCVKQPPSKTYPSGFYFCSKSYASSDQELLNQKPSQRTVSGKLDIKKYNAQAPILPKEAYSGGITTYLKGLYTWGIGLVGLAAFVRLVWGGILYMLAGAVDTKKKATGIITDAAVGLLLALSSFLIVNVLNPEALTIKPVEFNLPETTTESPTPGPTPGETPTGPAAKCMTYPELQGYIDNNYKCSVVKVAGDPNIDCPAEEGTGKPLCSSGQGCYSCTAK